MRPADGTDHFPAQPVPPAGRQHALQRVQRDGAGVDRAVNGEDGPHQPVEDVLDHQRVDAAEAALRNPQAQHPELLLLALVGGRLAAFAEADAVVDAVVVLDHVQPGLGLVLQVAITQPGAMKIVLWTQPTSSIAEQAGWVVSPWNRRSRASVEAPPCRPARLRRPSDPASGAVGDLQLANAVRARTS